MTTAWSHLPTAVHIDRILASVKSHPEEWSAAWDAAQDGSSDAARNVARVAAWNVAVNAARAATLAASRYEARDAARNVARAVSYRAWRVADCGELDAAWAAIATLIAWDDCARWLDMPSDQLRVWGALSEDPACILLLPAVVAFEKINELQIS